MAVQRRRDADRLVGIVWKKRSEAYLVNWATWRWYPDDRKQESAMPRPLARGAEATRMRSDRAVALLGHDDAHGATPHALSHHSVCPNATAFGLLRSRLSQRWTASCLSVYRAQPSVSPPMTTASRCVLPASPSLAGRPVSARVLRCAHWCAKDAGGRHPAEECGVHPARR